MDCSDTVPALYETVILTLSDGDDYDISGGPDAGKIPPAVYTD